jgi:RHS repeat-associated protein
LGRRLKTVYTPLAARNLVIAKTQIILSYFDPNVEFLEIGVKVNNQAPTWKAYGVDKDGTHGGLNGIGGLEMLITPTKTYSIIQDALGHIVATHNGTETKRVPTKVGSYGPLPESLALPLSTERGLHEVTNWLGKRIDETGYINLGARPYNPQSGDFPTADPLGHAGSWDLYSLCNGDNLNNCDPTGRLGKGMFQGAAMGDYFEPENTAQGIGKFIGRPQP